jgi:hypothetical protein
VTTGDDLTEAEDDPDYISQDGVIAPLQGGLDLWAPGLRGSPTPVFVPKESTPLHEDGTDGVVPTFALWAMKYQRHAHLLSRAESEIRERYGSGDRSIYVIDDGRKHCMIARMVGTSPDGCTICLVAHITMQAYEDLIDHPSLCDAIFTDAQEPALCAVFEAEEAVSNVAVIQSFATADEVPAEYLPPHPPIEFAELPGAEE